MGKEDSRGFSAVWEAGRRAYPSIPLTAGRFEERVRRVREAPPEERRGPDLFVAVACAEGIEEAWSVLGEEWIPLVRAFLRSRGATEEEAEAVCASLPAHLFEPPAAPGGAPRIAGFRGDSSLFTWLAVVARRLLGRSRRAGVPGAAAAPADGAAVDPAPTPLQSVLGRERALRLEAALHEAWGALTPRECLAVLLKYRDGLPQREIARLLDVGEPRVSRLLDAGLRRLREEVLRRVRETPPGPGDREGEGTVWAALQEAVRREMTRSPSTGLQS